MSDVEIRMKQIATELRAMAEMAEGGALKDVAYAAIPAEGEALMGLASPFKDGEAMRAALAELSCWFGNKEANEAGG